MLELFVQLFKAVLQLFLALLNPIFLRFCMFCAVNCLIGTIIPIERALKKNFDKNGNRK